ncbi:MAG TPA: iron-sulfur cluster assembly protein [Rubricoccaceae bacterium]|jgi:metal-sulfur cluster biosynthetic enzyme
MDPIVRDFLITGREVDDLSPLEEAIRDVCRGIYDPEIPVPIWDLGLIYGWTITPVESEDGVRVDVRMTLTAPNCPAAESLPAEVEVGVNGIDGVAQAAVEIVFVPSYSMEMLGDEARLTLGLM